MTYEWESRVAELLEEIDAMLPDDLLLVGLAVMNEESVEGALVQYLSVQEMGGDIAAADITADILGDAQSLYDCRHGRRGQGVESLQAMNLSGRPPEQKTPPFVSTDLRKFARGKECQMKSEWCNHDPSTVVLCHSRRGAGAGMAEKPHDFWGYHGCSACHAHEDQVPTHRLYDAIRRTQYAVFAHFGTLTP